MMAVTVDTYTEPMVAQTDTDTEDTSDIDYDCACAVYRPYFSCSQLPYTTPSSSGRSSDDRFDTDSDKEDTHKEHVSSDGDDTLDTDVIISYAPGNMKKTVSVSKLLCDIGNQSNSDDDDDHSECELNLDCALWHPDNKKNKKQRQPDVPPETPVMNISDRDCDIRSRYRSKSYAEILQNDIPIPRNDQRLQTTALLCSSSTTYNIMDIAQMSSSTGAKSPLSIETTAQSECDKSGNTNLGTSRKPCLVLDLDDTLIRSEDFVGCSLGTRRTDDSKVYGTHPPNKGDNYRIRDFGIIDTDTYDVVIEEGVFTLHIRPGARVFIQEMSVYFELAVCSLGTREYVSRIVAILDPDSVLFGGRILDRDDLSDGVKDIPSEWAPDGDFLVIDDLPSVWKPGTRVIRVPRFFCKETELAAYSNSGVLPQLSKFIKTVFTDYQMQSAKNCVQGNTHTGLLDRIYNKSLNGTWVFDVSYKEANSLEEILNAIIKGQQEERQNEVFGRRNNSYTITSRQRSYSVPPAICF